VLSAPRLYHSDVLAYLDGLKTKRTFNLEQIVREKQLEAVGVLPPQAIRTALQTPLEKHLSDYVADLQAIGRDDQYIFDLKNRVSRLMNECHWTLLKEVSSDSFLVWRARQTLAPKTLNEYLASARSLFTWMAKRGRIDRNPLTQIQKVQSNGKQLRPRRAFTRKEFQRLLAVAGPRKALYMAAVFTGLRRGELAALEWDDVHLDAKRPFLKCSRFDNQEPQGGRYQSSRRCRCRIAVDATDPPCPQQTGVRSLMPRIKRFRADLKRANMDYINARGQRADFHALRYTLATNLALAGTPPHVAMEIMRHSDMRLTSKTYTDTGLLPVWDSVANLHLSPILWSRTHK
jgi:integrase